MGFEGAYRFGDPPWDIGRAQPAIVRLAAEGLIAGDVIDVGCGTGENAIHLASRGLAVVGVDAASTAQSRQGCKHVIEPMLLMTPVREPLSVASVRRGHRPRCRCRCPAKGSPWQASPSLPSERPPDRGLLGGPALLPLANERPRGQRGHGEDRSAGHEWGAKPEGSRHNTAQSRTHGQANEAKQS
jgi:hypothetical protein